jgi:hypothetical protein
MVRGFLPQPLPAILKMIDQSGDTSGDTLPGRVRQSYPAPTASHVPALAVNTTVAMKITASIRDKVHAVGICRWPPFRRSDP